VLFNDTIFYNIAYGRPSATRAEVEEAARLARIHDFVMALPDGYDTRVGERGLKLSGGERQRVAIARSLINEPTLLLADEPTGNLDQKTGETILEMLLAIRAARRLTMVVVSHDERTAARADRVVRLVDGRVADA
jgi:ATP-binding cassette subfamily B protein